MNRWPQLTLARRDAAVADPLPWAMADRRGFKITGEDDGLWLRVLDPVVALEARSYEADGDVRIAVSDPLGFAMASTRCRCVTARPQ
jgi:hypothetical protein